MSLAFTSDLHRLRHEIADLFNAGDHDVELDFIGRDTDGTVQVRALLHNTTRTSNKARTIYGSSLFALAELTGSVAMLVCVWDLIEEQQPAVFGTTHGGTITYMQATQDDIVCTLVLPPALVQAVRADVQQHRKSLHSLVLDMHDSAGQRVAQAMLSLSARQVRERTVRQLPAVGQMTARLRSLIAPQHAYIVGS